MWGRCGFSRTVGGDGVNVQWLKGMPLQPADRALKNKGKGEINGLAVPVLLRGGDLCGRG